MPFAGTFDGNNKVIKNIVIERYSNTSNAGLFSYNTGTIKNLIVEDAKVMFHVSYAGVICGNNKGTISDCYAKGNIEFSGSASSAGGICGQNLSGGTITKCHNEAAITRNRYDVAGVCAENSGTISDCYNTGAITGNDNDNTPFSGICGKNKTSGRITKCYNTGKISGLEMVGGVCGSNGGTIEKCYNKGEINGTKQVGGICGTSGTGNSGTITNCYNLGKVTGTRNNIGGISGYNWYKISLCYSSGEVSGSTTSSGVGAVCGSNDFKSGVSNCYYNKDICTLAGIGGSGYSTANYLEGTTGVAESVLCGEALTGFDSSIWNMSSSSGDLVINGRFGTKGGSYPTLKDVSDKDMPTPESSIKMFNFGVGEDDWQTYTEIKTKAELLAIGNSEETMSKNYVLMNDIDLGGSLGSVKNAIKPIGWEHKLQFTGKFSGNGYSVLNLSIQDSNSGSTDQENIGLFYKNKGTIEDLLVNGVIVMGNKNVGIICGYNDGTIRNCISMGTLQNCGSDYDYFGGICGSNSGTIEDCIIKLDAINAFNATNLGVVCGDGNGTIKNCYYNKEILVNDKLNNKATGLTTMEMIDANANKVTFSSGSYMPETEKGVDENIEGDLIGKAYYTVPKIFEGKTDKKNLPSVKFTTSVDFTITNKDDLKYNSELNYSVTPRLSVSGAKEYGDYSESLGYTIFLGDDKITMGSAGVITGMESTTGTPRTIYNLPVAGKEKLEIKFTAGELQYFEDTALYCYVDIKKLDLTAEDFTYTAPTDLVYDKNKHSDIMPEFGDNVITESVGKMTVKYFDEKGKAVDPINAGTYTFKVSVAEGEGYNAAKDLTSDAWTFTIQKADQTITCKNNYGISLDDDTIQKIEATTDCDGKISYAVTAGDDVIKVDANGKITTLKSGEATVTVTASETANYNAATMEVSVNVGKKLIDVPENNSTYTYNGKEQTFRFPESKYYTIKDNTAKDAGEHTVTFELTDKDNTVWNDDNTTDNKTCVVTIKPACYVVVANSYTIKVGDPFPTFDCTVYGLLGDDTRESVCYGIGFGTDPSITDTSKAGEYTIKIESLQNQSLNYNNKWVSGKLIITDKTPQTITASDITLTYGESKKINAKAIGNVSCSVSNNDVIEVSADGTIKTKKAGVASVTIKADGNDTYAPAEKVISVTVNKANVTIKANDKTMIFGSDDRPNFDYTIIGLVDKNDTIQEPYIPLPTSWDSGVGTYPITLTISRYEDDKYIYTTKDGIFTIKNKSTGGGSSGGSTGGSSGGGYSGGGSGGTSVPKNPAVNGKEMSWDDIKDEISKLKEGENVTLDLNGNTKVPKDVVKAIAESKSIVKIKVNNNFSWTIDGSKLKESDIKDIDFEVKVVTATGTEIIRGTIGTGFKIDNITDKATLNISFKAAHAGKFANLYKKVDGKLVFVDNVKIDENGNANGLSVHENGEYAIMLGDMSDRPGDMNNDGILNAKDALAVLRHFAKSANGKNPLVSDVNGDGFINAKDALIILKKAAGLL